MRKIISLLLALTFVISLCACEPAAPEKDAPDTDNDVTTVTIPTEPEIIVKELKMNGITVIDDVAEIEIINAYVTKDVMPPKVSGVYTHYEASSGNTYIVVVMDIKNIGTSSVNADKIVSSILTANDIAYQPTTLVENDDGASLDRGSSCSINALDTARVYQMYSVPENTNTSNLSISIFNGNETYSGNFALDNFKSKIEPVAIGSVITDDDSISLTIDNIYFKNTLYPPRASGYYHYFEAANGKTYLIVKMTVTNLKGTDMKYDSIAGVNCVYNNKYNYSFFTVLEKDGGEDLNSYPSQYAISPLDKGVVYYLAEVPAEVENGPVEVTFYIAGNYYKYSI